MPAGVRSVSAWTKSRVRVGNYLLRQMTRVGVDGVAATAEVRAGFVAGGVVVEDEVGVAVSVVVGVGIVPAAEELALPVVEIGLGLVASATCDLEALGFFLVMIRDGDQFVVWL